MGLVRKRVFEIAYLRLGKHSRAKSLVGFGDSARLVTYAAETARSAKRRLEELGREVVTTNARAVREVLSHRLICVSGFLFGCEMAITALNLDVFLLIVRKASMPCSIFGLFNRERSRFVSKRGLKYKAERDRCYATNHKQLKIEN